MTDLIPVEIISRKILLIRGQKVMLDRDLAELYGVETRVLKQSVRRNKKRFPVDFMFELTREEIMRISQIVTSSTKIKYSKVVHAFSEQGVAMLSTVLNSERAIEVNIEIMRAFVRLREVLTSHKDLAARLKELENYILDHDEKIQAIFKVIHELIKPDDKKRKKIGFTVKEKQASYGRKSKREGGIRT